VRGRPAGATAIWVGALALAATAAVGTAVYLTERKASASPGVLPPGPPVSTLPTTGDVYGSLSAAQQNAVQMRLYAYIMQQAACPTVFAQGTAQVQSQGIMSASDLSDSTNRQMAVDCFQQSQNVGQLIGAGVLDVQTYQKLTGA
jgi:hypothetical protein